MTYKLLDDADISHISGGNSGVITYDSKKNLLEQHLGVVNADDASFGVASNTGDGNGNFKLNAYDTHNDTFFNAGIITGAGYNGLSK